MSVSTKILLFAAVGIGVTCLLGSLHLYGVRTGRSVRERVISSYDQFESLDRWEDSVWPYLNAVNRAQQAGQDTEPLRHAQEALVNAAWAEILGHMENREEANLLDDRREELTRLHDAMLQWGDRVAARVRAEPEGSALSSALEWELFQDYAQHVGVPLSSIRKAEREELDGLRLYWNGSFKRALRVAGLMTLGCVILMGAFALGILLPLRRSLRTLQATAERIGHGDFDVSLPFMGGDELGLLARTLERMAGELRETFQEKQRLMKAEAAELEARWYSAMLEDTVRARTRELEESMKKLEATQDQLLFSERLAAVGRLAAGIGHEINNPLSYILSNLRFIRKAVEEPGTPSPEDRQDLVDAVTEANEGAERVRLIVQDLKMLSRPDDLALGPVDLGSVVRGTAKIAAQELRERARLVEECEGAPLAWGNAPRLGQVLLNLLINAAHAIEKGKVDQNQVRVAAREGEPGYVLVEVSDTGCGIPPENLGRIFEPFFTTKPVGEGTGLGLPVCQSIITSLGGSLEVKSEVGRGTTFVIRLRRAPEPDQSVITPGQA